MYLIFNKKEEKNIFPPIPAPLKRRLGYLGTCFFESVLIYEQNDLPWVVSTRHGDLQRMVKMFDRLFLKEEISPTDFSLSVHNALIGQYSIFKKNTQNMTAISAGKNSFALGFFEAFIQAKATNKTIGFIYYDTLLDTDYALFNPKEEFFFSCLFSPIQKGHYKVFFNTQHKHESIVSKPPIYPFEQETIVTSFGSFSIHKV
ncbi:MAG: hypothetical protein CNLJKLNK_00523 [Holosporales bacterium]